MRRMGGLGLLVLAGCTGSDPLAPARDGGRGSDDARRTDGGRGPDSGRSADGGRGPDGSPDPREPDARWPLDAAGPDGMLPVDAAPEPEPEAMIFDERVVRTYRLTVAAADWQWLNDNATLEQFVPADLDLDGEAFAQAGLRFKGDWGTLFRCFDAEGNRLCDKVSLKLSFNRYDDDGRFHGLKKLNFHSMESDPSKMHDAVGYRLFRDHGVPASRTAFAHLEVNGESLGLYAVVENVDGRFDRARFPDGGEGNLYQDLWPGEPDLGEYFDHLETNEDDSPSVDRMVRFGDALADAGDAGFGETIAAWTDLEAFAMYFVIARLIDHWDDVTTWYCWSPTDRCVNHNYFWYESTAEDRVWLIPWDLDHTFEEPSPLRARGMPDWDEVELGCDWITLSNGVVTRAPACDPLLRRVASQLAPLYAARSQAVLAGAFSPAAMDARIDELEALLEPHVATDPFLDPSAWADGVDALRDAIDAKRAFIGDKLAR